MVKIVITGNPGVGKHTSAKFVIQRIGSGRIIDINKLAMSKNAYLNKSANDGTEINTKKVAKLLADQLRDSNNHIVIVGHLAPYVLEPTGIDLVVVLRRSPYKLMRTFRRRKYSFHKMMENVASEILGITLYDSLQTFRKEKIAEVDTTAKTPAEVANEILLLLQQKKNRKIGTVDWLSLVRKKGDIEKFLEY